jgi:hypothetical protein
MKRACLFLFGKFENLTNFDAVYVRGGYRGHGTIGFVVNTISLADCFEVIMWFQKQFKSKHHSFYRYTIDIVERHERLSIFIAPHNILKKILFEDGEKQVSLAVFLNTLNNLNFDYLQMKIEEDTQQRESR